MKLTFALVNSVHMKVKMIKSTRSIYFVIGELHYVVWFEC